jgi:beta-alanine degradation protein BauB
MKNSDDSDELRRALLAALPLLALGGDARAQDAALTQPRAYRVVLENEAVRVLEFNSKPGMGVCGSGMHSHPAHLSVALSPAKARVRLKDGTTIVAENRIGDVWWSEAETHETENISGRDVRALLIELKPAAAKR